MYIYVMFCFYEFYPKRKKEFKKKKTLKKNNNHLIFQHNIFVLFFSFMVKVSQV